MSDQSKLIRVGLAIMLCIGVLAGGDRTARADETVQAGPAPAVVTIADQSMDTPAASLHVQAATQVYDQKYRDYFWMRNNEQDMQYTSINDGIITSGNTQALLVDCRFYFPMDLLMETFGEEMAWDGNLHRSYVVHDGTRIYISTIKYSEVPFVKVRDFELLGYQIQYQGSDNQAQVVINKF